MISDSSVPDHARAEAHRILAIEDDSATQRALKRLFESEGYDVDLAKDGTAGLELFHKRRPSAIVLDLRLPDISGREVCQKITQVAPGLPVIVLSATADVADKIVLLEIGARDYVTKPFSPRGNCLTRRPCPRVYWRNNCPATSLYRRMEVIKHIPVGIASRSASPASSVL